LDRSQTTLSQHLANLVAAKIDRRLIGLELDPPTEPGWLSASEVGAVNANRGTDSFKSMASFGFANNAVL